MTSPLFPLLDALSDGRIIRRTVSIGLQIIGAIILLAGVVGVLMTISLPFQLASTPDVIVGGVLYSTLLGAGTATVLL